MPIDIIESGYMSSALQGWQRSRDLQQPATVGDIVQIDASVNELPSALLHFKDYMIIERELFVTPRNHVIWARTSRVDDPRSFRTPPEFANHRHTDILRMMRHLADSGVPQDKWRLALPLCSLTSWSARISYRDAVRMVAYFADVADYIGGENERLSRRLNTTALHWSMCFAAAFGISKAEFALAVDQFKGPKLIAIEEGLSGDTRNRIGEFVSMQFTASIAMRAQLVRHREIMFADTLLPMLRRPIADQLSIGTPITMQAVALDSTWQTVLGKRTCWMAQQDLWSHLASLYGSTSDGLPCADGHCPYAEDAKQRLAGNDPGAPCPRYSNLNSIALADAQFTAAAKEAAAKPNAKMWLGELERQAATKAVKS
jgi:hypothetical protein